MTIIPRFQGFFCPVSCKYFGSSTQKAVGQHRGSDNLNLTNRICVGVEAETRKSQASFLIIHVSSEALPRMRLKVAEWRSG